METEEAYFWLVQGARRQAVLARLIQPATARQLSHISSLSFKSCVRAVWELTIYKMICCLNKEARSSRLYWLTALGEACQKKLLEELHLPPRDHDFPEVDWQLYGWVCFSHRKAIIKALTEPLQPAAIKRQALKQESGLRMSANNVRDVIRLFLKRGIVQPVKVRGKAHRHYDLTDLGRRLRDLLVRAEVGT